MLSIKLLAENVSLNKPIPRAKCIFYRYCHCCSFFNIKFVYASIVVFG